MPAKLGGKNPDCVLPSQISSEISPQYFFWIQSCLEEAYPFYDTRNLSPVKVLEKLGGLNAVFICLEMCPRSHYILPSITGLVHTVGRQVKCTQFPWPISCLDTVFFLSYYGSRQMRTKPKQICNECAQSFNSNPGITIVSTNYI